MTLEEARAEVLAVEAAWTQAHLEGDLATMALLMAEDYVRINPDGSVATKAQTLATYTPETRYWELAESDEHILQLYGDTAIVVGRWRAKGVNNKVSFDYAARFMSVYTKKQGQWQMVAEQSTTIS